MVRAVGGEAAVWCQSGASHRDVLSRFLAIIPALVLLITWLCVATPARCQDTASPDAAELGAAYREFHAGKAEAAIARLKTILAGTAALRARARLERDLIEICATAYEWRCVDETIVALLRELQQDSELLHLVLPEANTYLIKELLWTRDYALIDQVIANSGPAGVATPASPFLTLAELQIALHAKHIEQQDFAGGENAISAALLDILLTDPKANAYYVSKALVGLIGALIHAQDIVGAFAVYNAADGYISNNLGHGSIVYAEYRLTVATLFTFTDNYALAIKLLLEAYDLYNALEINDEVRLFKLANTNSLATAALILTDRGAEAMALHARHPLQGAKERILSDGAFHNLAEFLFAVSDVFVARAAGGADDVRWRPLLEKVPDWQVGEIASANLDAYRHFALGLIDMSSDVEQARRELMTAARKWIDNFEAVIERSAEGFKLPSLFDRVVLLVGLQAATGRDAEDILLRAGEILNRSLRHALGDATALINSQPDEAARELAKSYVQLIEQKRNWTIDKLKALLAGPSSFEDKGALINAYNQIVEQLSTMRREFQKQPGNGVAAGLPSVAMVQKALSPGEVFVTVMPVPGGVGKLCIGRGQVKYVVAQYAVGQIDPTRIRADIRLLEFATTSSNPPDPVLDSQFPVASALALYELLFSGLEPCFIAGVHATVALPNDFAGIPLGALLDREPPHTADGYDLGAAPWLIKRFSFSSTVSARQFVAEGARRAAGARRPYLGIGDPIVSRSHLAEVQSTSQFRGAFRTGSDGAEFRELPESREEILQVSALLGAARSDVLLGQQATEEMLRSKSLSDYEVIHFATHGLLASDVPGLTESALLLSPGDDADDPYNDGLLSASEISRLSLNARLVVLSACNSAKYDAHQASLGIRDLHAAFTFAGGPTLLASLWPVESKTARDLVISFFEDWRLGKSSAASSLARATRRHLAKADTAHQHPRFWASFVIVGDGGALSSPQTPRGKEADFAPLRTDGGTVFGVARSARSVFLSMASDWDGKKMASIVTSQVDGRTRWSVSSRDIGAGRLLVGGDRVYAIGYTTEINSTPVIRSLTLDGRLLWEHRYADFKGYSFADGIVTQGAIFAVAVPQFIPSDQSWPAFPSSFLLKIGVSGEIENRVAFEADESGLIMGAHAVMQSWGNSLFVAVNRGQRMAMNEFERNVLGWPPLCYSNAATTVFQFGIDKLSLTAKITLGAFRAEAMKVWNGKLYIGGEGFDNCAMGGSASLYELDSIANYRFLWHDPSLFRSSIQGLAPSGDRLWIAVNYERPFTVPSLKRAPVPAPYHKRVAESGSAFREASIYSLSTDGAVRKIQTFAAGLSIYVFGIESGPSGPITYGEMGGMPAASGLPN
jgi:CHAT domain-containing protein